MRSNVSAANQNSAAERHDAGDRSLLDIRKEPDSAADQQG
jgi:hypothetical protein